jgi:flagellar basal-body rod protein FlgB
MALTNLFSLLSEKMDYLTQRQGVVAQNIAQANTPNYKPKDIISFDEVLQKTQFSNNQGKSGFQLATTNPKHVSGLVGSGLFKTSKLDDKYEVKPSGNAVNIEQQMSQMSDTTSQYQMMTGLYKKTMSLLKTALGRGGA